MNRDAIALFRELADRSPSEREAYYARHQIPAALRTEVESLLRFDSDTADSLHHHLAAAAQKPLLAHPGAAVDRHESTPADTTTSDPAAPALLTETDEAAFHPALCSGVATASSVCSGAVEWAKSTARPISSCGSRWLSSSFRKRRLATRDCWPGSTVKCAWRARSRTRTSAASTTSAKSMAPRSSRWSISTARDLASLLRRIGRLPHGKAIEIARRLCAGLAAAHDKGVVHRDLKPAVPTGEGWGVVA